MLRELPNVSFLLVLGLVAVELVLLCELFDVGHQLLVMLFELLVGRDLFVEVLLELLQLLVGLLMGLEVVAEFLNQELQFLVLLFPHSALLFDFVDFGVFYRFLYFGVFGA
jgi:hypothetical protein